MMIHSVLRPRGGFGLALVPTFVLLMSGTAHAALTADQVWQSWKDAGALAGLKVSAATEAKDGGSLMLNGVTIAPEGMPGVTISDMVLAEQSDGTVLITPGADIGMNVGDEATMATALKITHDGLQLTAREDGGALVYDYAANSLTADYKSSYPATSFGEEASKERGATGGLVTFDGLSGTYSDTPGANRAFGLDIAAAKLIYEITSDDPGLGMKNTSRSETADIAMGFDVALPQTMALIGMQSATDFAQAMQEGMSFSLSTKQGVSQGSVSQSGEFMPYDMTMTTQPGVAEFLFNKDVFSVKSTGDGLALNVTSPGMPAPVDVTIGPVIVNMLAPVMAGETAGDFAYQMKLSQLTVNDEAWAMLDPGAALKRDPADLSIDVTGKAKIDFLALMAAEETGAVPPIPAPEALNINDLTLKIAGAAFAGSGAFTFDNSAGVPMPLGEANVSLTGGNALIDGLIKTGLVSEDDAMGARMMMGMFFTPGADADSLTSKIEAKAGNEIYVNGQRIQ